MGRTKGAGGARDLQSILHGPAATAACAALFRPTCIMVSAAAEIMGELSVCGAMGDGGSWRFFSSAMRSLTWTGQNGTGREGDRGREGEAPVTTPDDAYDRTHLLGGLEAAHVGLDGARGHGAHARAPRAALCLLPLQLLARHVLQPRLQAPGTGQDTGQRRRGEGRCGGERRRHSNKRARKRETERKRMMVRGRGRGRGRGRRSGRGRGRGRCRGSG